MPNQTKWTVLQIAGFLAALLAGLWTMKEGWRRPVPQPVAQDERSEEPADHELEQLVVRLDRELRLPTVTAPVPLELLREHDAKFAGRRSDEVRRQLTGAEATLRRTRIGSELAAALHVEINALRREQRSLNRLTDYAHEDERNTAHAEYRDSRVEAFLAVRARKTATSPVGRRSVESDSRREARHLAQLKRLDKQYSATVSATMDSELALLARLRRLVGLRDPLYKLITEEIAAWRRAKTMLGRTRHYRAETDRAEPMNAWLKARSGAEQRQLARINETQGRVGSTSALYWDYDLLAACLAESAEGPLTVDGEATPKEALCALATRLRREDELTEAKRRLCASMGRAADDQQTARLYNLCAVALQKQLDGMEEMARAVEEMVAAR